MQTRRRTLLVLAVATATAWSLPISIQFPSTPSVQSGKSSAVVLARAAAADRPMTITVNPKFYALNPCEKRQFTATVTDADGQEVKDAKITWQSTSPEIAKIDDKGVAVALKPGSTMIKPIFSNGKGDPASLFVREKGVDPRC